MTKAELVARMSEEAGITKRAATARFGRSCGSCSRFAKEEGWEDSYQ
jgi:nucleoid DNA-binding protein